MNTYSSILEGLKKPDVAAQLTYLYGADKNNVEKQLSRYEALVSLHKEKYNQPKGLRLLSAPGRIEIGGNHTDHNRGKVLAAAINLDVASAVAPREDDVVQIFSVGNQAVNISLQDLSKREGEKGTTAALVRGIAFWLKEHGYKIGGFNAVFTSDVAQGSGLSSSAAVEVLICYIFDVLYNGGSALGYKDRGIASTFSENAYFGKPCGMMDQMASSAGGLVFIDFEKEDPLVEPIENCFVGSGFVPVVVNSGGSHDDLTPDYAAIPQEMRKVAEFFGEKNLRNVSPDTFYHSLPELRKALGTTSDRALLRAFHFFEENERVDLEVDSLKKREFEQFFSLVKESGHSSFCYLQNIYPSPLREEMALALKLSEKILGDEGAWRVHGGGFAGTTLNFVPNERMEVFSREMKRVFGANSCFALNIRSVGPTEIQF